MIIVDDSSGRAPAPPHPPVYSAFGLVVDDLVAGQPASRPPGRPAGHPPKAGEREVGCIRKTHPKGGFIIPPKGVIIKPPLGGPPEKGLY